MYKKFKYHLSGAMRKNELIRVNFQKYLLSKHFNFDNILNNKILVGTHHKTGTVWLNSIFTEIAKIHNLMYLRHDRILDKDLKNEYYDILFDAHSNYNLKEHNNYKGLHVIRDPFDIVVSCAHYHQHSREEWLHRPMEKFGGKTYQQKINSYNSIDDKLLFEMDNSAGRQVTAISKWNYSNPNFIEIKYESLIKDTELTLFHKIFINLGFDASILPSLLIIVYNKSIFSGKVHNTKHIRSGKVEQYKTYFKEIHYKRFNDLFGNVREELKYE